MKPSLIPYNLVNVCTCASPRLFLASARAESGVPSSRYIWAHTPLLLRRVLQDVALLSELREVPRLRRSSDGDVGPIRADHVHVGGARSRFGHLQAGFSGAPEGTVPPVSSATFCSRAAPTFSACRGSVEWRSPRPDAVPSPLGGTSGAPPAPAAMRAMPAMPRRAAASRAGAVAAPAAAPPPANARPAVGGKARAGTGGTGRTRGRPRTCRVPQGDVRRGSPRPSGPTSPSARHDSSVPASAEPAAEANRSRWAASCSPKGWAAVWRQVFTRTANCQVIHAKAAIAHPSSSLGPAPVAKYACTQLVESKDPTTRNRTDGRVNRQGMSNCHLRRPSAAHAALRRPRMTTVRQARAWSVASIPTTTASGARITCTYRWTAWRWAYS